MCNRRCEFNVPESFTPYLSLYNFNSAFVTYYSSVFHPLIFTAYTFPVFHGPEYLCTEKPVSFRLKCPVVYGLRLFHLSVRPRPYFLRRGKFYRYSHKLYWAFWFFKNRIYVFH